MPSDRKVLTGYVKTVTMMWYVFTALAVGFTGGVLLGVYRTSSQVAMQPGNPQHSIQLTQQQQETIKVLLDKTRTNPNDPDAWTQLGHVYFDSAQHDLAIAAYEKSLALNDRRPDVWVDLGVMYRRHGTPEKAIESFDRALQIDPKHKIALFNKGVVSMHDLNDSERAIAAWELLLQVDPHAKTPGGKDVIDLINELKKNSAKS